MRVLQLVLCRFASMHETWWSEMTEANLTFTVLFTLELLLRLLTEGQGLKHVLQLKMKPKTSNTLPI